MIEQEKIDLGVKKFLNGQGTIQEISKELKFQNTLPISNKLRELGYYGIGSPLKTVLSLTGAVHEYITNIHNKPSLAKISRKYGTYPQTLSRILKKAGYTIINYQNKTKFNECIFDSIDTEEKAYWLGFIYADGYISNPDKQGINSYHFELSLKNADKEHLRKFNKFMEHEDPNHVKTNIATTTLAPGKTFLRCRWAVNNRHLWETLNNYGCTPSKSHTLQFPNLSIFKDKKLIKDFIRGYWDGDGCISNSLKGKHVMCISVLGTKNFLTNLRDNLPLKAHCGIFGKNSEDTKVLTIHGKNAFYITYYLYEGAKIYLERKYKKYKEYCRIYEESYILLQVKNGRVKLIDNSVLNEKTKEFSSVQSVEVEPEISD